MKEKKETNKKVHKVCNLCYLFLIKLLINRGSRNDERYVKIHKRVTFL